jgi:hypothetical protein
MNDLASSFEAAFDAGALSQQDDRTASLLALGTETLAALAAERLPVLQAVTDLLAVADDGMRDRLQALRDALGSASPTIALAGQVNAGKTSVLNALMGQPGFLPVDVNPWTSAITTVHANGPASGVDLRFFANDDHDALRRRPGLLAARTGAADADERLGRQLVDLRRGSDERRGPDHGHGPGGSERHDRADAQFLARYLCMGDADTYARHAQGHHLLADLTRQADIHLPLPQFPLPLSLRDTPGVNDTLLLRERLALEGLDDADMAVLVLSAPQALSTVDLALLHHLARQGAAPTILFVNRIDELDNPAEQVPEIRAVLEATLARYGIGRVDSIVFGSARWAEAALSGKAAYRPQAGQDALPDQEPESETLDDEPRHALWQRSGMPDLLRAMGDGLAQGSYGRAMRSIRGELKDLIEQRLAALPDDGFAAGPALLTVSEVQARLGPLAADLESELRQTAAEARDGLRDRLRAVSNQFVDATVATMTRHVELYGPEGAWECDPMGLRVQLRAAFMQFATALRASGATVLARAAADLHTLYGDLLGAPGPRRPPQAPPVPQAPAPVAVGDRITLELAAGRWTRWRLRRRGPAAFAKDYRALIAGKVDAIVTALEEHHVRPAEAAVQATLRAFLDEHAQALAALASRAPDSTATASDHDQILRERLSAAQALLHAPAA